MTGYLTASPHVIACDLGPATVIVNYQTGGTLTLMTPSARWWADLATTGDPSKVTSMDVETASLLGDWLRHSGALVNTATPVPWDAPIAGQPWTLTFGTEEAQAGWTAPPSTPRRALVLALIGLALTLLIQRCGRQRARMGRTVRLLNWAAGRKAEPASTDEVTHVLNAVRRVGLLVPTRVACLEESTAAVVALSLSGRRATWCHGIAGDPIRLHAWVALNGRPVAEPQSTLRYTSLRTIPEQS